MVGYSLTGCTREECLFFLYGTGANGKSKFLNAVDGMLGDYAQTAPIDTFIASSTDHHPTDLAGLRSARLVTSVETEEGRRWAESKIKSLTGGDTVSARFMRQTFSNSPRNSSWLSPGTTSQAFAASTKRSGDAFIWCPSKSPSLRRSVIWSLERNCGESGRGYFNGRSKVVIAWQPEGLNPPSVVRDATAAYLASEDHIARWIEECCVLDRRNYAKTKLLYEGYCSGATRTTRNR